MGKEVILPEITSKTYSNNFIVALLNDKDMMNIIKTKPKLKELIKNVGTK